MRERRPHDALVLRTNSRPRRRPVREVHGGLLTDRTQAAVDVVLRSMSGTPCRASERRDAQLPPGQHHVNAGDERHADAPEPGTGRSLTEFGSTPSAKPFQRRRSGRDADRASVQDDPSRHDLTGQRSISSGVMRYRSAIFRTQRNRLGGIANDETCWESGRWKFRDPDERSIRFPSNVLNLPLCRHVCHEPRNGNATATELAGVADGSNLSEWNPRPVG